MTDFPLADTRNNTRKFCLPSNRRLLKTSLTRACCKSAIATVGRYSPVATTTSLRARSCGYRDAVGKCRRLRVNIIRIDRSGGLNACSAIGTGD